MTLAGIAGRAELPEERVEFQEKDIMDIAGQLGLELKTSLEGVEGSNLLKRITNPSEEPYWKLRYKGGCQDIFFITTLDRAPEFAAAMQSEVKASGYPAEDTGVYLQPRHQGVNCHCEFNLPYDPRKMEEVSRIQQIYTRASKDMLDNGAFFTRPYGIWADMAFSKDAQSTALLKNIKNVFDPNNIMNPGKLCFKVQETKER